MPVFPAVQNIDPIVISVASPQSIGAELNAMGLTSSLSALATANKAYFIPFSVYAPFPAVKMMIMSGVPSGNVDTGVYDRGGKLLFSAGSTPQSNATGTQPLTITPTTINPGEYFLAMSMDNTVGTVENFSGFVVNTARVLGIMELTNAFPLPSVVTFQAVSGVVRIPWVGVTRRLVV